MKIAFIVSEFPTLSETFILNQITGLLDLGHDIEIFARFKTIYDKVHPDVKKYHLLKKVYYFDINIPSNILIRLLMALYLFVKNFYKNPIPILKSLNIFKYGRKTLSLELFYELIPFLNKRFDVIHCQFGYNGNLGAYLKQIGVKSKLITTFHGCDIRYGIEKGGYIYHQLFKYGNLLLAISDYNYKNLIRLGADPQKIIFHPVGIDVNKFLYKWQSNIFEHQNPIIILTVARLVKEKGLQYGICAIKKLLKKNLGTPLEYHIVGGGYLEEHLKKLIKKLDVGNIVRLIGPMEQEGVIKEMLKADIFLLPSIAEALPVVLMEAQAVGLPIVATSVGSISQIVINGKSGFLVPERDVDSLADKIGYLIKHPELWSEMGRHGRKIIEEKYNIKKLNKQLVEIYKNPILEGQYC